MSKTIKILNVVGARPNFMKIAPLIHEMKKSNKLVPLLVHTGQHYDKNMSDSFFVDLNIPDPDYHLGVGGGSQAEQTAKIMIEFEKVCIKELPDLVLVVGDVNSTIAAALVAKKLGIKVAHVEAGLRSFDRTMPEEINRIITDSISDFLFITEQSGMDNLEKEGIPKEKVFFVGNVMIDCLINNLEKIKSLETSKKMGLKDKEFGIVTLHRPSNVDNSGALESILKSIEKIQESTPLIWPIHPRTKNNIEKFGLKQKVDNFKNVKLTEPLGYLEFISLVINSKMVLTDSGGIQEETTFLGVPCITLRENTERPVTVTSGTNILVGTNKEKLFNAINTIQKINKKNATPPLWDGKASERIVRILEILK